MNWFKRLFVGSKEEPPLWRKLLQFMMTLGGAENVEKALTFVGKALPFVKIAGDIITSLTPTTADDMVWAALKKKYPLLFDGKEHTPDEIKNMALLYVTEAMQQKYNLSTTTARTAAQLAYNDYMNMSEVMKDALQKQETPAETQSPA